MLGKKVKMIKGIDLPPMVDILSHDGFNGYEYCGLRVQKRPNQTVSFGAVESRESRDGGPTTIILIINNRSNDILKLIVLMWRTLLIK